jgi:hypothetical protein
MNWIKPENMTRPSWNPKEYRWPLPKGWSMGSKISPPPGFYSLTAQEQSALLASSERGAA